MNQIKSDSVVMNRFKRHFGMTSQEVINYFSTLKMSELKQDGVYLVYNVPESEEIRARAIFYKKGTKVWVDQNGGLVLKASCGNPMVVGTDKQDTAVNVTSGPIVEAVRPPSAPITASKSYAPGYMPMDLESSAIVFPAAAPADITGIVTSSFNAASLLPLAAVPFIFEDDPQPIPEPGTMIALASGAGLLVARRRKRKKNA